MHRPHLQLLALLCSSACAAEAPISSEDTGMSGTTSTTNTTSAGTAVGSPTTTGDAADTTSAATDTGQTTGAPANPGCDGASLLPVPEDTSLPGPWPVGARTAVVDDLTLEVWYPATPGSESGAQPVRYDIRTSLPDAEQGKVPDAANPWQDCDCWRDLPIDGEHGPYPVIVFIHGTAGFRSQSLEFMTHWASRGFVVVAADHPGLWLKDLLGSLCMVPAPPQDLAGDLAKILGALAQPQGGLEFLADRIDPQRLATTGHSAGGFAVEATGDVAQVVMPMAGAGVATGAALRSVLVLGAQADKVVKYSEQQTGYTDSPAPKRLVGLANTGHLAFSSLCSLRNADELNFLEIATQYDVCGAAFASVLFDCDAAYLPDETGWQIVEYVTSAALEQTLHCSSAGDNFTDLQTRFPDIGEFKSEGF